MRKRSRNDNGADRLEEALRQLTLSQATMTQTQAAFLAELSETKRENAQRFARIEADIGTILRVLAEHGRILQALPEAVRDKNGFTQGLQA